MKTVFILFYFIFWDHQFLDEKTVWISDFGRKIRLILGEYLFFLFFFILEITCFRPKNPYQFRWRPFFFFFSFEITCFWAKNPPQFLTNRLNLILKQWKFGSRLLSVVSLFQKSPPFFQILATRLNEWVNSSHDIVTFYSPMKLKQHSSWKILPLLRTSKIISKGYCMFLILIVFCERVIVKTKHKVRIVN